MSVVMRWGIWVFVRARVDKCTKRGAHGFVTRGNRGRDDGSTRVGKTSATGNENGGLVLWIVEEGVWNCLPATTLLMSCVSYARHPYLWLWVPTLLTQMKTVPNRNEERERERWHVCTCSSLLWSHIIIAILALCLRLFLWFLWLCCRVGCGLPWNGWMVGGYVVDDVRFQLSNGEQIMEFKIIFSHYQYRTMIFVAEIFTTFCSKSLIT